MEKVQFNFSLSYLPSAKVKINWVPIQNSNDKSMYTQCELDMYMCTIVKLNIHIYTYTYLTHIEYTSI